MNRDAAETLALQALAYVVGDDRLGPMFLDASGIGASDLAARATEPVVMVSVLSFLMQDDRWIRDFCAATQWAPEDPQRALWALPGGAPVNWT